jgi:hypothetical protein
MGGAQQGFVHGISTLIPTVTVSPANRMSQQFSSPIFSGRHQIHNFLDLGRKSTLFQLKVGIRTFNNYIDRLLKFGSTKFRIEKVNFSKVHHNHTLLSPKPLGFYFQIIFKPPWPTLTIHGKLFLVKSRGNSNATLNFQRLTMLDYFHPLFWFQPGDDTSNQPYKPPWHKSFYSRMLFLLNSRGNTSFILTFQHLILMKFSCSWMALFWLQCLPYLIHFNHFRRLSLYVRSNLRWYGNFSTYCDQILGFQLLVTQYYCDCWNIDGSHNSTHTLHMNTEHISVHPITQSISRDFSKTLGPILPARICLHDTCQQLSVHISRYIYDE